MYITRKDVFLKVHLPVNLKSCHPWLGVKNISLKLKKKTIITTFIIGIVNNLHTNLFIYLEQVIKLLVAAMMYIYLSIYHNIVELTIH